MICLDNNLIDVKKNDGLLKMSNIETDKHNLNNVSIAGFDLDGTLIGTKSGKTFPKDFDDWRPLYMVEKMLNKISLLDDYMFVIFTNQKALNEDDHEKFCNKVIEVMNILNVKKYALYMSYHDNYYRKPMTGMFDEFIVDHRIVNINHEKSFYCGDAAGRSSYRMFKSDHSNCDYNFAYNSGLNFFTPEEFFTDKINYTYYKNVYNKIGKSLWCDKTMPFFESEQYEKILEFMRNKNDKKLVLFVGLPGSGKSMIANILKQKFKSWTYINNDTQGTGIKPLKNAINNGKNIIVDNTNLSISNRTKYYNMMEDYKKIIIWCDSPDIICMHLNYCRAQETKGKLVPKVAYRTMMHYFTEPETTEAKYIEEIFNVEYFKITPYIDRKYFYKMYLDA